MRRLDIARTLPRNSQNYDFHENITPRKIPAIRYIRMAPFPASLEMQIVCRVLLLACLLPVLLAPLTVGSSCYGEFTADLRGSELWLSSACRSSCSGAAADTQTTSCGVSNQRTFCDKIFLRHLLKIFCLRFRTFQEQFNLSFSYIHVCMALGPTPLQTRQSTAHLTHW